ncbi:alanine racemase [Bradyrhizobium sp. CCBAU 21362]|nr:alanine racemase [Bradyrhizobium sp. CCBAU 21362]
MSCMNDPVRTVEAHFDEVDQKITLACKKARRERTSVTLIAVSKTVSAEYVRPVLALGHNVFGENRVQEAKGKWYSLLESCPSVNLHLVGPLQSNMAKEAVGLFHAIHSVDRPSLCEALAKVWSKQCHRPTLFVQLNTGKEPQKGGIAPDGADDFIARCRSEYGLPISGLMCMPPLNEEPQMHFRVTAEVAARNHLKLLSMGMSTDFEIAIQYGATHVRIGSGIFGRRAGHVSS